MVTVPYGSVVFEDVQVLSGNDAVHLLSVVPLELGLGDSTRASVYAVHQVPCIVVLNDADVVATNSMFNLYQVPQWLAR
jgi:hypothetical protein